MPRSALAISELEEQLLPPVQVVVTSNVLANVQGVLHNANIWLATEAQIQQFVNWFGRTTSEQEFGECIEPGMVRLAARYLRDCKKWSWHMRQCEGDLRWGWWLAPYVLSKDNSKAPPGSNDLLWWPCVCFWSDGRCWMICLHLLWYNNEGWEKHIQRIVFW